MQSIFLNLEFFCIPLTVFVRYVLATYSPNYTVPFTSLLTTKNKAACHVRCHASQFCLILDLAVLANNFL